MLSLSKLKITLICTFCVVLIFGVSQFLYIFEGLRSEYLCSGITNPTTLEEHLKTLSPDSIHVLGFGDGKAYTVYII
jgi:hypothetical protein